MFITTRYFYPNGIEGESMSCTLLEHDTIEKAIKYCHRYNKGIRFAGIEIEDEKGNTLYQITSDGDVYNYIN